MSCISVNFASSSSLFPWCNLYRCKFHWQQRNTNKKHEQKNPQHWYTHRKNTTKYIQDNPYLSRIISISSFLWTLINEPLVTWTIYLLVFLFALFLLYIDNNILQHLAGKASKECSLIGSSHSFSLNRDCQNIHLNISRKKDNSMH